MYKKLFCLFLIIPVVVIFFNVAHTIISFVQKELYETTQNHLAKNNFEKSNTVCFSENDLKSAVWKEEKEFTLKGFSYDVINIYSKNGTKYFYCYLDKKDIVFNSLLKVSEAFTKKNTNKWKCFELPKHAKKLIKTSNFFVFFESEDFIFFNNNCIKSTSEYYYRLKITACQSIVIPPPEWVS